MSSLYDKILDRTVVHKAVVSKAAQLTLSKRLPFSVETKVFAKRLKLLLDQVPTWRRVLFKLVAATFFVILDYIVEVVFLHALKTLSQKVAPKLQNFKLLQCIAENPTSIVMTIVAPFMEETSKYAAKRFGFLAEYTIVFNVAEFSNYMLPALHDATIYEQVLNEYIAKKKLNLEETDFEKFKKQYLRAIQEFLRRVKTPRISGYDVNTVFQTKLALQKKSVKPTPSLLKQAILAGRAGARLAAVFMHITNAFLHAKGLSGWAYLVHFLWNLISVTVAMRMSCK